MRNGVQSIPRYDAVVAGASVAGCILALLLAREGLSVLVLDKKRDGTAYKVLCTHFIQPLANDALQTLDLLASVVRRGGLPTRAAFWTPEGWIDPPGAYRMGSNEGTDLSMAHNVERSVLDPLLLDELHQHRQIDLVLDASVASVVQTASDLWQVSWSTKDSRKSMAVGRVVVAADGRRSTIAREVGNDPVSVSPNDRSCQFGYFVKFEAPRGNRSLFLLDAEGMSFIYPLGDDRALIANYIQKGAEVPEQTAKAGQPLLAAVRRFPISISSDVELWPPRTYGYRDYPNILRRSVFRGVAFVGDAAISLDPMSGVGCAFAIRSAQLLASTLAPALRSSASDEVPDALQRYAGLFDDQFGSHAAGIVADSIGSPFNPAKAAIYRKITNNPDLAASFIALTGRVLQPARFQRDVLVSELATRRRNQSSTRPVVDRAEA